MTPTHFISKKSNKNKNTTVYYKICYYQYFIIYCSLTKEEFWCIKNCFIVWQSNRLIKLLDMWLRGNKIILFWHACFALFWACAKGVQLFQYSYIFRALCYSVVNIFRFYDECFALIFYCVSKMWYCDAYEMLEIRSY